MPTARRVYDGERHAQFITFSCYRRRRLLAPDRAKRIVIGTLGAEVAHHDGMCIGFVVMPDHVHALVWFDTTSRLSAFMDKWKELSSKEIKAYFRREHVEYWSKLGDDDAVWQPRYYPFNVFTGQKLQEKLDYMHMNPVRAGLVERATDWPWSSARWHIERKPVGLPIRVPQL